MAPFGYFFLVGVKGISPKKKVVFRWSKNSKCYMWPENEQLGTIRILLLQHRALDCAALTTLFRRIPKLNLLSSTTSLRTFVELCREHRPDVAILDATLPGGAVFYAAEDLVENHYAKNVLFLDDKVCVSHANQILDNSRAGYFTRNASLAEFQKAIERLNGGEITFDPLLQRIPPTDKTSRQFQLRYDMPALAKLTSREIEVMRLLAKGHSVRDAASKLNLAMSTVDNHSSRLKKKLGIHKISELTRIAMREGLVD